MTLTDFEDGPPDKETLTYKILSQSDEALRREMVSPDPDIRLAAYKETLATQLKMTHRNDIQDIKDHKPIVWMFNGKNGIQNYSKGAWGEIRFEVGMIYGALMSALLWLLLFGHRSGFYLPVFSETSNLPGTRMDHFVRCRVQYRVPRSGIQGANGQTLWNTGCKTTRGTLITMERLCLAYRCYSLVVR